MLKRGKKYNLFYGMEEFFFETLLSDHSPNRIYIKEKRDGSIDKGVVRRNLSVKEGTNLRSFYINGKNILDFFMEEKWEKRLRMYLKENRRKRKKQGGFIEQPCLVGENQDYYFEIYFSDSQILLKEVEPGENLFMLES